MTGPAPELSQPRLFPFEMGERTAQTLVRAPANAAALDLIGRWRAWPGGAALLFGPCGSGRSHIGSVWAGEAHAGVLARGDEAVSQAFAAHAGRLLVDDADLGVSEEAMIRLFDLARYEGGHVLFIARAAPAAWTVRTPDLRSRLLAAPAARLEEPDDMLLAAVLRRLCRDRYMELTPEAAHYLTSRMERTFAAARAVVEVLDTRVRLGARPISAIVAGQALDAYGAQAAGKTDVGDQGDPPP